MRLIASLQNRHVRLLLQYPGVFLGFFLLLTVPAGFGLKNFRIDVSSAPFFPDDDPATLMLEKYQKTFSTHETILLAVEFRDTVFTDAAAAHLTRLHEELAQLPGISSAWSMINVDTLAQYLAASRKWEDLRRYMLQNPRYRSSLVCPDGRAAAIILGPPPQQRSPEQDRLLARRLREVVEEERQPGCNYYFSGMPVIRVEFSDLVLRDQRLFGLMAAVLLSLFMFLLFRTFWGVLVPLSCGGLSVIWTLGLFFASGHSINLVSSVLSLVVVVISMTNSIHLINYYVHRLKKSGDRRAALQDALDHALLPCLIATVTTVLGFLSLLTSRIPAVVEFTCFAALGIAISFVLTGTLVPILLYRWADLKSARRVPFDRGLVAWVLAGTRRLMERHRLGLTLFSLGAFSLLISGIARVHTTMDVMDSFPQDSPLTKATLFLQERFLGAHVLEILVVADRGDLLTVENLLKAEALDQFIFRCPEVKNTLSALLFVWPYLESYLQAPEELKRLMPMQQSFRSTLAMMRPSQRELLHVFMDRDYRSMRISAFLKSADSRTVSNLADRIQTEGNRLLGPGMRVELTGELLLFSRISTELVHNLLWSLLQAFGIIFLVLGVLFRSVKAVLAGILPNLLPVLALFGIMGWAGIPLNVPTSIVACITLGLAVDDTTHFLHNYRTKRREGGLPLDAAQSALATVGRAMIFTSLTLVLGFSLGLLSPFHIIVQFGFLSAVTMLLALWCDLTLLPVTVVALERVWGPGQRRRIFTGVLCVCCLCATPSLAAPAETGQAPLVKGRVDDHPSPAAVPGAVEARPAAARKSLRLAALAPEGSPWAGFAHEASRALAERTEGSLTLKWHLGAIMGDEGVMLARIRTGRLSGAVVSMAGLAKISPSLTLLSLPFLFHDTEEAGQITRLLTPRIQDRFREKGIVLTGLFSLGFGRVFTLRPVKTLDQLRAARIWAWKGDSLGQQVLQGLGFREIVPLEMTDVLPALQFGMIDAFSGTYFSITVLQWFPYGRCVIPLNWTYTLGGIVIGQRAFAELTAAEQQALGEVMRDFAARLTEQSLRSEQEAEAGLTRREGLRPVLLSPDEIAQLEEQARRLYREMAAQMHEEDLLREIQGMLEKGRTGRGR